MLEEIDKRKKPFDISSDFTIYTNFGKISTTNYLLRRLMRDDLFLIIRDIMRESSFSLYYLNFDDASENFSFFHSNKIGATNVVSSVLARKIQECFEEMSCNLEDDLFHAEIDASGGQRKNLRQVAITRLCRLLYIDGKFRVCMFYSHTRKVGLIVGFLEDRKEAIIQKLAALYNLIPTVEIVNDAVPQYMPPDRTKILEAILEHIKYPIIAINATGAIVFRNALSTTVNCSATAIFKGTRCGSLDEIGGRIRLYEIFIDILKERGNSSVFITLDGINYICVLRKISQDNNESPIVLMIFISVDQKEGGNHAVQMVLRETYGFTATETNVAILLSDGLSPADISKKMGVSIATIRTHLSRSFEKTKTNGQAELCSLLEKLSTFL